MPAGCRQYMRDTYDWAKQFTVFGLGMGLVALLPILDMITDIIALVDFCVHDHPWWATFASVILMLNWRYGMVFPFPAPPRCTSPDATCCTALRGVPSKAKPKSGLCPLCHTHMWGLCPHFLCRNATRLLPCTFRGCCCSSCPVRLSATMHTHK